MLVTIEDISLLEISAVFSKEIEPIVINILRENNLAEHMEGFFKSETHIHTYRVSDFSCFIALKLGLSKGAIDIITTIAPFHDFGKLKIPESILAKPDKLTKEEFEEIKKHPKIGYDLLKDTTDKKLDLAALVALQHHEKWDGSGYPYGLKHNEIHLYTRIITAADVLDSLISNRCYKKGWEKERVRDFFVEQNGKHFDPFVADIVLANFDYFFGGDCNV